MKSTIDLIERGYVPDFITRLGIRHLLGVRLKEESQQYRPSHEHGFNKFLSMMDSSPIAMHTKDANAQHYEVPSEFFVKVLGPRLKYSCSYYNNNTDGLGRAEEQMLSLSCERAELQDGMKILELGCGWGSLTLWMAEKYPNAQITAVSNSRTQKEYIDGVAQEKGFSNVTVVTMDMNDFESDQTFDRVVSIEMFEHMRNYKMLLGKINKWLKKDGKLFVHIFCHKSMAYTFETEGDDNWMGRHFFSGGIMPSHDLLTYFPDQLAVQKQWDVNGNHYAQTCRDWLNNLDTQKDELVQILDASENPDSGLIQLNRWRMFFLACEELFAYKNGDTWFVGHYLLKKP